MEAEVTKVGRKYFYIGRDKYYLDTMEVVSEYAPDYEVYFTEQDILDKREKERLYSKIGSTFGSFAKKDLTLEQLRKIQEIIEG